MIKKSTQAIDLPTSVPLLLDGHPVDRITAFLFHQGGHENPKVLLANADKSFVGSYVLGMGFTFDDTNEDATSIAEMERLIATDSKNQECIFPYIGGSEVNSSPTHEHHRYVINFGEMSEDEARKWPELMAIVEEKVKPKRLKDNRASYRTYWWHYAEKRIDLCRAIANCDRVLVIPRVTQQAAFTFLRNEMVYSEQLVVFAANTYSAFCTLSACPHEIWIRFFGSSLEDRLRYTPSDCFETFPFPENWEIDPTLEAIGKTYYEYRADLMVRNNQGLTDTYNRFHNPDERDPDILKLRDLHDQMDRAVLNAYGWDIDTTCGFALDYLDADPETLPPEAQTRLANNDLFFPNASEAAAFDALVRTGKRKLPWRYRWPEATHDEVLTRLLTLNHQRYEAEVLAGKSAGGKPKKPAKPRAKKSPSKPTDPTIPGLGI